MEIKTKKQLNLPQLIEWAWDKDVRGKVYPCVDFESKSVTFNSLGWAEFSDEFSYNLTDTFTVEVEEEITEDTQIPNLRHLTEYGFTNITRARSIDDCKNDYSVAFYIINDDYTITLIWTKDKGLVE